MTLLIGIGGGLAIIGIICLIAEIAVGGNRNWYGN